jgi:hypothetical protein
MLRSALSACSIVFLLALVACAGANLQAVQQEPAAKSAPAKPMARDFDFPG